MTDVIGRTFTVTDEGRVLHNGDPFTGEIDTRSPSGVQQSSMTLVNGWMSRNVVAEDNIPTVVYTFDPPGYIIAEKRPQVGKKKQ